MGGILLAALIISKEMAFAPMLTVYIEGAPYLTQQVDKAQPTMEKCKDIVERFVTQANEGAVDGNVAIGACVPIHAHAAQTDTDEVPGATGPKIKT